MGKERCRRGGDLFEVLPVYVFQHLHLLNRYPVETDEALALRESFGDEHGVQVLHVREANQLVHRGIVAHVAFQVGVRVAPFEGSDAEHGYVQHVGFAGIDARGLLRGDFRWDEVLLDGISVDAVVYLREFPFGAPAQLGLLLLLEALEFTHQIYLEFGTNPHSKLKRDVLVRISAPISSGFCLNTDGMGFLHIFFHADFETVQSCLVSNCGEFAIIKIRII